MILFLLLISRHGKIRLSKFFTPFTTKERNKIMKDCSGLVIGRSSRLTNFLEYQDFKLVFKRYASLYFVTGVTKDENELNILEVMHHFVELLDRYFGNVCELDIIFNFHAAYFLLDEIIIGGHIQETSKKAILKKISQQDLLLDEQFFKDDEKKK